MRIIECIDCYYLMEGGPPHRLIFSAPQTRGKPAIKQPLNRVIS